MKNETDKLIAAFALRMSAAMKARIQVLAEQNRRSANSEMVVLLESVWKLTDERCVG
jgi:hypothetical protein